MHVDQLQVDLNLKSVLFDDIPKLTAVHLNGGSVYIKVLEDGSANYNIAMDSGEEAVADSSEFRIEVNQIRVNDVDFIYDDRQLKFFMALADLNLDGSGDFS